MFRSTCEIFTRINGSCHSTGSHQMTQLLKRRTIGKLSFDTPILLASMLKR
ncbi:hypothetical protein Scep_014584 [Stephania cephalantha]|uniref:Uncharacterized protein n=1 Tax=Stephania cephalantha TaxID=152367 RepID=A0AAP0P0I8_9MAGN